MSQYKDAPFTMLEALPLLPLPQPPPGRTSYNMDCPLCGDSRKHLNINLLKNVFKCPRCGAGGGVLALYAAIRGCTNQEAYDDIRNELQLDCMRGNRRQPVPGVLAPPQCEIADVQARHEVYSRLLSELPLEERHREDLLGRGLAADVINRLEYRSYPRAFHALLARTLQKAGLGLEGIPGFYIENRGWRLTECAPGFLIPVRDGDGRIQGLQIRLDDAQKRKYRWISSSERHYGCGADGSCIHVAGAPGKAVVITEGALKADIIHHLMGICTVGIIGVSAQKYLPGLLARLGQSGVRKAYLAFDMDFLTNEHVVRDYDRLRQAVSGADLPYSRLLWNAEYKGLDDYLAGVPDGARAIRRYIRADLRAMEAKANTDNNDTRRSTHDHCGGSRQFGDQDSASQLPLGPYGEPDRTSHGGAEHPSEGSLLDS